MKMENLDENVFNGTRKCFPVRSFKFDQEWVQVLINLRMKYSKLFTRRRNSASDGWKMIYEELKESGAPEYITIANIKKKWMNLMTRYRQIKNSTVNLKNITWPYFEQINRAFGRDSPVKTEEAEKKVENILTNINNDERQNFIKKLIELRYNHRHLFTGRKYTARDGWMIIRSLLQCDDRYTVEQLSKCWQNLVQRYKQLARSEAQVTWPYYQLMHNWFNEENPLDEEIKIKPEIQESYSQESNSPNDSNNRPEEEKSKKDNLIAIKAQLNWIRTVHEKYHLEIEKALKVIEDNLKD